MKEIEKYIVSRIKSRKKKKFRVMKWLEVLRMNYVYIYVGEEVGVEIECCDIESENRLRRRWNVLEGF